VNPDRGFETTIYSALNRILEPLIRAGMGSSPCFAPFGATVLEVAGRTSGKVRKVPLLAASIGDLMVVSTVRPNRSQWIRNLAANPEVRFWRGGRARTASAYVFHRAFTKPANDGLPPPVRKLADLLQSAALPIPAFTDLAFAILSPR
jgi:deazaflavin-dependent oxidoreductase (nitroreductase family)